MRDQRTLKARRTARQADRPHKNRAFGTLGARAARSHTAALTDADARYDAIFAQYGVIRVQDYDELLEIAHLLAHTPTLQVPGIAVVSHSGGISSLTADMCGQAGLDLPPLGPEAHPSPAPSYILLTARSVQSSISSKSGCVVRFLKLCCE